MKLHLGVIDVPYSGPPRAKRSKRAAGNKSTFDVATILEAKYGVMQTFYDLHAGDIAKALESSLGGAIENLVMGAPVGNPFGTAEGKIDTMFRTFLTMKEMDGRPGVPTDASGGGKRQGGINHRFKHPYRKSNPTRPSFIDTGLYQANFKSWME